MASTHLTGRKPAGTAPSISFFCARTCAAYRPSLWGFLRGGSGYVMGSRSEAAPTMNCTQQFTRSVGNSLHLPMARQNEFTAPGYIIPKNWLNLRVFATSGGSTRNASLVDPVSLPRMDQDLSRSHWILSRPSVLMAPANARWLNHVIFLVTRVSRALSRSGKNGMTPSSHTHKGITKGAMGEGLL